MHVVKESMSDRRRAPHQWVGAAVVGLGDGASSRAEHAHRTGRHVLRQATRIEVLEVYCHRCRVQYTASADLVPCAAQMVRAG
jgi:hypothetical protein